MAPADVINCPRTEAERLAVGLGWFSIGLGLAEALAPRNMARLIGAGEESAGALRMLGVREIAHDFALEKRLAIFFRFGVLTIKRLVIVTEQKAVLRVRPQLVRGIRLSFA